MTLLKPVTVEEIEFYVSDDGTDVGISISGLARLCGVTHQAISTVFKEVERDANSKQVKTLKLTPDKLFSMQAAENNAKVVTSIVATRLIRYYAYESKYANETAKYSLEKFLELGFDNWVKQITGYADNSVDTSDLLSKMYEELLDLKKETKELRALKAKTKENYKGLDKLIDTLSKEEDDLLPPDNKDSIERDYTVTEWLREEKGIYDISTSFRSKLAIMISQHYKTTTDKEPTKGIRRHSNGKINNGVQVYKIQDFPIMDWCLTRLLLTNK